MPELLYNDQNVKIRISTDIEYEENWADLPALEKVEILKRFAGKDKFPNTKVGKYDVYHQ